MCRSSIVLVLSTFVFWCLEEHHLVVLVIRFVENWRSIPNHFYRKTCSWRVSSTLFVGCRIGYQFFVSWSLYLLLLYKFWIFSTSSKPCQVPLWDVMLALLVSHNLLEPLINTFLLGCRNRWRYSSTVAVALRCNV